MKEMVRNEEQIDDRTWWQRNKKKVLGCVITGITVVGGILLFKYRNEVSSWVEDLFTPDEFCNTLPKSSVTPVIETPPIVVEPKEMTRMIVKDGEEQLVHMHLRNLPEGWTPSVEKLVLAEELGIDLKDGQTWVAEYIKNKVA